MGGPARWWSARHLAILAWPAYTWLFRVRVGTGLTMGDLRVNLKNSGSRDVSSVSSMELFIQLLRFSLYSFRAMMYRSDPHLLSIMRRRELRWSRRSGGSLCLGWQSRWGISLRDSLRVL